METVSGNTLYYRLNKDIGLDKIGKDIHKLLKTVQKEYINSQNLILTIKIVNVSSESFEQIPKLEYKNLELQ